jgi:hypothetical protein
MVEGILVDLRGFIELFTKADSYTIKLALRFLGEK